ncbi:hypothetical protein RIF29_08849 [Crotalaria pallida]|uniref:Uncharacterized protein n=1 Tax=Crotalaria pallida TaxID=3830 RepID=A0AAN9FTY1_CROPI
MLFIVCILIYLLAYCEFMFHIFWFGDSLKTWLLEENAVDEITKIWRNIAATATIADRNLETCRSILLKFQTKYLDASRYSVGASLPKSSQFTPFLNMSRPRLLCKEKRLFHCFSVADSDQLAADAGGKAFENAENAPANDRLASVSPNENFQSEAKISTVSGTQTSESSNGSIDQKQESAATPNAQSTTKRSSLTARERVRAARVLNRYTEPKSSKPDIIGSKVLDALRESDRGKKRSRLPEAPTNLFDDNKRGMPKQGLTFDFPGGFDLFLIAFSFVFISTVMIGTTYLVWKVGAIHFNEY